MYRQLITTKPNLTKPTAIVVADFVVVVIVVVIDPYAYRDYNCTHFKMLLLLFWLLIYVVYGVIDPYSCCCYYIC
jgi:hypothetical protein